MQYLEIIEFVLPELIDKILEGVGESIICTLGQEFGGWRAIETIKDVTYIYLFEPNTVDEMSEDTEIESKMVENYQAYVLKEQKLIKQQSIQLMKHNSQTQNQTRTSKFMQSKLVWEKFQTNVVPLAIETEISIEDDQYRQIKLQQLAELKKQQQKQQIRLMEQRKLKEIHQKLEQNLKKTDYTYDFDCQPLIKKSSPLKSSLIQEMQFHCNLQQQKINKANIQNRRKSSFNRNTITQLKQLRSESQIEEPETDRQISMIPYIQVQDGVKFIENTKMINRINDQICLNSMKRQAFQQLDQEQVLKYFENHINNQKSQEFEFKVKLPDENGLGKQITQQSVVEAPLIQFVDPYLLKQQMIKLPKLRSIHVQKSPQQKTQRTDQITNTSRIKSKSIHSNRDHVIVYNNKISLI